jgi:Flp pilus assembly protein TadB
MQAIKFFMGILLVQAVTVVLFILSPDTLDGASILRLIVPLFFISLMVAFWFSSLVENFKKDAVEKVKESFLKERETLLVKAEQAKTRVVKQAQKEIAKEAKVTHAKANFKVGAAFAGVLGVGALFVFAQMITVGLLVMSATGGAMGGYIWRGRRLENKKTKEMEVSKNFKVIESKKKVIESKKKSI